MCNDYRFTSYCKQFRDVALKKQTLDTRIRDEHRNTRIMYNQISKQESEYRNEFMKIYNFRCAYCGVSTEILNIGLFEIDHFICKSSTLFSEEELGSLNNLVLACRCCNRNKRDHKWPIKYNSIFSPDNGEIANVFVRDEKYYIRIVDEYISNPEVNAFYKKLQWGTQKRRLDYLIIEMCGFKKLLAQNPSNSGIIHQLNECIYRLKNKRNLIC